VDIIMANLLPANGPLGMVQEDWT